LRVIIVRRFAHPNIHHCNVTGRARLRATPGRMRCGPTVGTLPAGFHIDLSVRDHMTTKMFLLAPLAAAILAGCAATNDSATSSQSSAQCADLSGAAYLECQKKATPAANTTSQPFKMVRPKAPNGDYGSFGSR
jgi:hypothetical protein